ncbi:response regulator transcription factor [Ensifer adhaerens]|uniref:response regulator transcription factor n=1 Tax=Ensifer adhaerens TaxID=106592 RepID=UPI000CF1C3A8|nr:response regulator transcription factor [Ensifer adhaerens]
MAITADADFAGGSLPRKKRNAGRSRPVLAVIEDKDTRRRFASLLTSHGYDVQVTNATMALRLLTIRRFDLLLLEGRTPPMEWLKFCRQVRSVSDIALVLIADRHDDTLVVEGLNAGADASVLRVGEEDATLARLHSILRRTRSGTGGIEDARVLVFDGWRIDPQRRTLHNRDGQSTSLTAGEFDILLALARNSGRVLSRRELLEATRFGLAGPSERSVDVHVRRLRQKIEPVPDDPIYVKTVRLGGYMLTHTVEIQ